MQTNILWSGIEYFSLENCVIDSGPECVLIDSVIVGYYENILYRVEYTIELNTSWEIRNCQIKVQLDDEIKIVKLQCDNSKWLIDERHCPEFDGCIDIDIPLTPLTNSLPINRLNLLENEEAVINVIYIDLLEHNIRFVKQKYRRISELKYRYENIPNDFEAEVTVDEDGYVVDYPLLFKRKYRMESNYKNRVIRLN